MNSNLAIAQAAASTEHQVERHRNGRDDEGQPDRRERIGIGIGGETPTLIVFTPRILSLEEAQRKAEKRAHHRDAACVAETRRGSQELVSI